MKKLNYFTLSLVGLLLSTVIMAQTTVLGYFPSYRATSVIRYDKLTDIAFSFINPNTNGTLIQSNPGDAVFGFDYNKFVTVKAGCQSNGVNLWIALGGADPAEQRSSRLQTVCASSSSRATLVSELVNFAITHGCYGIDIDWEFPKNATARTGHYNLIKDLRAAINSSSNPNLKISIAVGGEYKNAVNHLQYIDTRVISESNLVDKVNIMAYDFPTSYNANHSSYSDAQQSMQEWNSVNGVPYAKMLLGIPFYARSASNELMYNQLSGNAATNYNSDSYAGYYYNGKSTIESKMDLVSNVGGLGILIWDLGQDRSDQYSLLDVIDAKAATLCPVPKPNLGADKGVCAGNSTMLDPGVGSAAGRSFKWYKDGVTTGDVGTTLSVSAAGTYKVEITQSGCTREDEIVIVTGSSVTTSGAQGCNNESLTVSVNNPDGGKTYKWYDAMTSGTLLHTGTSYSSIFTQNTTVYVEEAAAGVSSYTTSPATIPDGKFHSWAGGTYTVRCAQMLTVETDLTIKSMRALLSALNGCTFSVKVVNADNKTAVAEAGPFTLAGDGSSPAFQASYFDFDVDFALSPGRYLMYIEPTAGNEANYGIINSLTQESFESGVYVLAGSTFQNQTTDPSGFALSDSGQSWWTAYGPFLNVKIETGANASCGRTAADVTVQQCGPPTVSITSPAGSSDHPVNNPISLSADISDEGTITNVVFEVFKGGVLVETVTTSVVGSTYSGTFTPTLTGSDYSFKVKATDNDANTTEETVAFTVSSGTSTSLVVGEGVELYPNPSSSNFTIELAGASGFVLSVYTVSGQELETTNVTGSTATFGASYATGVYVVKAVSAEGTFQTQVVKK